MAKLEKKYLMDIDEAMNKAYAIVQKTLPYKTGNLSRNAFKLERTANGYKLYVDLKIAPYAKYIDQPGYKTDGYWEKAVQLFLNILIQQFPGSTIS